MAKTMAVIDTNNTVTNMISCSDTEQESDTLKNTWDYPAAIGDQYDDGRFFRNGQRVLSITEEYCLADAERRELIDEMAQMVEEVYAMDLEIMTE